MNPLVFLSKKPHIDNNSEQTILKNLLNPIHEMIYVKPENENTDNKVIDKDRIKNLTSTTSSSSSGSKKGAQELQIESVLFTGLDSSLKEKHIKLFQSLVEVVSDSNDRANTESVVGKMINDEKSLKPQEKKLVLRNFELLMNGQEYGFKAAHLMEDQQLISDLAEIPPILPIGNTEIRIFLDSFLMNMYGKNFETLWQDLVEAQGESSKITPQAKKILNFLRNNVEEAFNGSRFINFEGFEDFFNKNSKEKFVVRSSAGDEDTPTSDRAGEYLTKVNVEGNVTHVLNAMGAVICSYLAEAPFQGKINAGEKLLTPILPVLIQVMAGSRDEPQHFVGGTVFLEEPLGRTAKTAVINAAPGACGLVVDSEGPVDTYVLGEGGFHPIIAVKSMRRAPKEEGGTELRTNSKKQAQDFCLDKETCNRIYDLAIRLYERENGPVDLEFVVDKSGEKTKIFLLQHRPIVIRSELTASYVQPRNPATFHGDHKVGGTTVISADCSARKLSDKEAVHFYADLDGAFKTFQRMSKVQQQKVKVVIIAKSAIATSHAATQFRRRNIPILSLETPQSYATVKNWVDNGKPIAIDVLAGRVYQGGANLELKPGFSEHPIPRRRSLEELVMEEPELLEIIKKLGLNEKPIGIPKTVEGLLDILRTEKSGSEKVKAALSALLSRVLFGNLGRALKAGQLGTESREVVCRLARNILQTGLDVQKLLDCSTAQSPERLLPIKMLTSLIYQELDPSLVDAESLKTVISEIRHADKVKGLDAIPLAQRDVYLQYVKLGKVAFSQSTAENWNIFVKAILTEDDADNQQALARLVYEFGQAELHVSWLNSVFAHAWKISRGNVDKCLDILRKGYLDHHKKMGWLRQQQELMDGIERHLCDWQDPKNFDKLINKEFMVLFESIKKMIKTLPQKKFKLSREEALLVQRTISLVLGGIELVDQSIKGVTGTPVEKFSDIEEQVKRFQQMLDFFLKLLKSIENHVPQSVQDSVYRPNNNWCSDYNQETRGLPHRVKWLEQNLLCLKDKKNDERQLEARPDFDVERWALPIFGIEKSDYSHINSTYLQPLQSCEEIFTIIHNYCKTLVMQWEESLGSLGTVERSYVSRILPGFDSFNSRVEDIEFSKGRKLKFKSALKVMGQKIVQIAEIPARTHKGSLKIETDLLSGQVDISIFFEGMIEYGYDGSNYDRFLESSFYLLLGGKITEIEWTEAPYILRENRPYSLPLNCNLSAKLSFNLKQMDPNKQDLFFQQLSKTLHNMVFVTMPEEWNVLRKQGFGTLSDMMARLSKMPGSPDIPQMLLQLPESFFMKYPNFNGQFIDYFMKVQEPEKALAVVRQTILCTASSRANEVSRFSAPRSSSPVDQAIETLSKLMKNPETAAAAKETLNSLSQDKSIMESRCDTYMRLEKLHIELRHSEYIERLFNKYFKNKILENSEVTEAFNHLLQECYDKEIIADPKKSQVFLKNSVVPIMQILNLMSLSKTQISEVRKPCLARLVQFSQEISPPKDQLEREKVLKNLVEVTEPFFKEMPLDDLVFFIKNLFNINKTNPKEAVGVFRKVASQLLDNKEDNAFIKLANEIITIPKLKLCCIESLMLSPREILLPEDEQIRRKEMGNLVKATEPFFKFMPHNEISAFIRFLYYAEETNFDKTNPKEAVDAFRKAASLLLGNNKKNEFIMLVRGIIYIDELREFCIKSLVMSPRELLQENEQVRRKELGNLVKAAEPFFEYMSIDDISYFIEGLYNANKTYPEEAFNASEIVMKQHFLKKDQRLLLEKKVEIIFQS
jgi:phosphohistidine swiveling domain-containing protein